MGSKKSIYSRNKMRSRVEGVGTWSLVLRSGFNLILEKMFYIPSFSRNLISVSSLVPFGYSFQFLDKSLFIYYKFDIVRNSTLFDGLFSIDLQNNTTHNALHVQTGTKRCVINYDSSTLWHRRLGHIPTSLRKVPIGVQPYLKSYILTFVI